MKFVITAGGTGGHIYPALAVLDKIKEDKNNEYLYIGTTNRMEKDLIPTLNIPYVGIDIQGLQSGIIGNVKTFLKVLSAKKKCKKKLKDFKADAILALGGYVTVPVCMAAKELKIPIFLHEQNMIPGKANKFLSKISKKVFLSFEGSEKYFSIKNTLVSGNPCEERAKNMKPFNKKALGFSPDKKLVLIVMGSLGSPAMNEKILVFLRTYEEKDKELLYITGPEFYDDLSNNLILPPSTKIVPYFNNLPSLMKSADLIISRAGASTLSEIIVTEIPSILVPSPNVPNNHQYYNALYLENKGISKMILESDLNKENLIKTINLLLEEKQNKKIKEIFESTLKRKPSTVIYETMINIIGK